MWLGGDHVLVVAAAMLTTARATDTTTSISTTLPTSTSTSTQSSTTMSTWTKEPPVAANHTLHYRLLVACEVTGLPHGVSTPCNISAHRRFVREEFFQGFAELHRNLTYVDGRPELSQYPLADLVLLPFDLPPASCGKYWWNLGSTIGVEGVFAGSTTEQWNVGGICEQIYGGIHSESQAQCSDGCPLHGNGSQNLLCMVMKYPDAGCQGRPKMIGKFVANSEECLTWASEGLNQVGLRVNTCGRGHDPQGYWYSTSVAWLQIQPGTKLTVDQMVGLLYPHAVNNTTLASPAPMPFNYGRGRFLVGTGNDELNIVDGAVYWQKSPCTVLWRVEGSCGCGECGCACTDIAGNTSSIYDPLEGYSPVVCGTSWSGTCNTAYPLTSVTTTMTTVTTSTVTTVTPITHAPTDVPICERECIRSAFPGPCRHTYPFGTDCMGYVYGHCPQGMYDCSTGGSRAPTPPTSMPTTFPPLSSVTTSCPVERFPRVIDGWGCNEGLLKLVPYEVTNPTDCRHACCAWTGCQGYMWCGRGTAWNPNGTCAGFGENQCLLVSKDSLGHFYGDNSWGSNCNPYIPNAGQAQYATIGAVAHQAPTVAPTVSPTSPTPPPTHLTHLPPRNGSFSCTWYNIGSGCCGNGSTIVTQGLARGPGMSRCVSICQGNKDCVAYSFGWPDNSKWCNAYTTCKLPLLSAENCRSNPPPPPGSTGVHTYAYICAPAPPTENTAPSSSQPITSLPASAGISTSSSSSSSGSTTSSPMASGITSSSDTRQTLSAGDDAGIVIGVFAGLALLSVIGLFALGKFRNPDGESQHKAYGVDNALYLPVQQDTNVADDQERAGHTLYDYATA